MGTPLVIGIVIYLLLIIALTTWFLRLHLQKSLTDLERQLRARAAQATSLPSGTETVNLENALELSESAARDETPSFRSTETDLFPKKK